MTLQQAYAELMSRTPHAGRTPSVSFVAVLDALRYLGCSYGYKISRQACVDDQLAARLLGRMHLLGLAVRYPEVGDRRTLGRQPRVYYELTAAGRELASLPRKAAA